MNEEMSVIELQAPGALAAARHMRPTIEADGLLLKTLSVSICSTDASHYHGHLIPSAYPVVLGHEYCGLVVEVGAECSRDLIGKRISYFGQTDFGGLAEYRAIRPLFPGDSRVSAFSTSRHFFDDERAAAVVLPDEIESHEAPLIEPITAVLRAILSHPPAIGSRVLILGGGPCGAIAGCLMQSLYAVKSVSVLEARQGRQEFAREAYANRVYRSVSELQEADIAEFDYVFDALPPLVGLSPEEDPRRAAMRSLMPGSKYVLYGASQTLQQFDTWLLLAKGINLCSAAFDVNHFPMHKTAHVLNTARDIILRRVVNPSIFMTNAIEFHDSDGVKSFFRDYHLSDHLKTVVTFHE